MVKDVKSGIAFLLKLAVIALSVSALVWAGNTPTKVPGDQQAKKLVNKVAPVYPPEAKAKGITGTVRLEATVAKDGTIKELKVLSGDEVFIPNTVKAVKQWTYEQTKVNGQPVEVMTEIDVNFTLAK